MFKCNGSGTAKLMRTLWTDGFTMQQNVTLQSRETDEVEQIPLGPNIFSEILWKMNKSGPRMRRMRGR